MVNLVASSFQHIVYANEYQIFSSSPTDCLQSPLPAAELPELSSWSIGATGRLANNSLCK
jgi:hypothetical protein